MIRTLIVDDEPPARDGLRARLAEEPDIEIVGEAEDGPSAAKLILSERPDLVFLDVQMPGMDGFEVLARIARDMPLPIVVFVTAYDDYALKAFDAHALDYIMKPVTGDRFRQALRRARLELQRSDELRTHRRVLDLLSRHAGTGGETDDAPGRSETPYLRRLTVKRGDSYRLLDVDDVEWFQAAGNYVELHAGGRRFLIRSTMKRLERDLDPGRFTRIHRSTIVNVSWIEEIQPDWNGDFTVLLKNGAELRLSRTYRDRLLD